MNNRKNLIKLSLALLIFNLVLGIFAGLNFWQTNQELLKNKQDSSVLGVNSSIPKFDPTFIMSNQTFSSTRVFLSQDSIQAYLNKISSPLKNYNVQGKSASYWIFSASRGETSSKFGVVPSINPGVILAYLEKEQSLLSLKNYDVYADNEKRIKYATGYGCPDTSVCDDKYNGFINQVNWAAYQLQFNYNNASTGKYVLPYKVGNTISTLDEYNVFLTNEATAAQYRYTPHVYWGNYNLWRIIVSNGWGVDTNTYNPTDIDKLNLQNKDQNIQFDTGPKIALASVLPLLKAEYNLGDQNDKIKTVQTFLRQQGYYMNREITGLYGVTTDQALKNFRADKGIIGSFNTSSKTICTDLISANYKYGTTSDTIKSLQKCLQDLGVFNWPSITGYYGDVTQKAQNAARVGLNISQSSQPVSQAPAPVALTSAPTPQVTQTSTLSCSDLKKQKFSLGESSTKVKQIQDCMSQDGVFNWKYGSTGYFGPVSQDALNKWLGNKNTTTQTFSCTDLKSQTWVVGETSNRVKQLQDCMSKSGLFNWKNGSTGYFGDVTKTSLITWRGYF